jgi:hypothetical protein
MSKFAVETSIRPIHMGQRLFQRLSAAPGGPAKLRESVCPSENATNGLMKLTSKWGQEEEWLGLKIAHHDFRIPPMVAQRGQVVAGAVL